MLLTQDILDDFKAGRLDAFYRDAYPPLLTYAVRILSDGYAFLAEDCVQDCIFRSYQERDHITDPQSWRSFLYTAVHNTAVSMLRRQKAHDNYLGHASPDIDMPSLVEQETLDILYSAIERLPDSLRAVFDLSFEQGLSNQEIADRIGLSLSGVKKRKAKMLSTLRHSLPRDLFMLLMPYTF